MNTSVNFKVFAFLIVLLCAGCYRSAPVCSLYIINSQGRKISLKAEIADTDDLRTKGLMNRNRLKANRGMLFIFPREEMRQFWMKDTRIPLDLAYISSNGVINEIYSMKPLDISVRYPSTLPAQYALEVNRGWYNKNRITRGDKLILNGCISK